MTTIEPSADIDPQETREWLDALDGVIEHEGPARAQQLVERIVERAQTGGVAVELGVQTPYVNSIPVSQQPKLPGNEDLERRLRHLTRWNAMALVVRANVESSELGGHVASFASSATLYDVGFNHFFRAPSSTFGGDLVFFQGHSSPGVYARAYLEGRLSEEQMKNFRQEVDGKGLSSYPHSWLMPDFWQFAVVSMGLGPIQAIYQAKFLKYLHNRGIADTTGRKVWCFLGDGETDEPESLGAIGVAARENLDNLIFVVNCNLQRLDGPVRGNGKIIQELEREFRGAGWNVIKVIWGSGWDRLLEKDHSGRLVQLMNECVDGDYQTFKANDGAYVREHFFGRYPETAALVADWTDEQIWELKRGGHDARKVYAAYKAASEHTGQPTVVLAKTIKGYGMGTAGEGQNIAHQQKHIDPKSLRAFRDRFNLPIADSELATVPFFRPSADSPEGRYLASKIAELGSVPTRRVKSRALAIPSLDAFDSILKSSGDREISTTMAFVRILTTIVRDKNIGERVVPIVADESRTFGMEGMFRQLGIYSQLGQLYKPQDAAQLMYYREDKRGQILQEGINEAGAICSWIAGATSYSTSDEPMIPVYIFYSMFGFQRIGDLAWAAGDMRSRGFLIGGTSGRTTLNGEGLQHEDGHSHLFAAFVPNVVAYDPTYAYELATIVQDGLRRMYAEQEDVYYYITVMNENYVQPEMPAGCSEGILKGAYLLKAGPPSKSKRRVQLMGSGTILREVIAAAELLESKYDVVADIWSATSFTELRRNGLAAERYNLLHPDQPQRVPYVTEMLAGHDGPLVAATDYMKSFADQIRPFAGRRFHALGTDGYGRSDFRRKLRDFFEVDRRWIALAALNALADDGVIGKSEVAAAIVKLGIDPAKPDPATV